MRGLAVALMLAGAAGVVTTFFYAFAGDTGTATRAAGGASAAIVLGLILYNRDRP